MAQKKGIPDSNVPFVDQQGRITQEWLVFFQPLLVNTSVPTGAMIDWPTETPPDGWLERDGSAISRRTYAALFAVIGTSYGVGDGTTTFNLPDHRGRFPRYWDHGAGVDPNAATRTDRGDGTAGDHVGTKQAGQLKAHTHAVSTTGTAASDGAHTHDQNDGTTFLIGEGAYAPGVKSGGAHTHTTSASGTAGAITETGTEVRPINAYVMPLIKH